MFCFDRLQKEIGNSEKENEVRGKICLPRDNIPKKVGSQPSFRRV